MKGRRHGQTDMNSERLSGDRLSCYIQSVFDDRGREALDLARQAILEEEKRLESEKARDALHYFMNSYWNDTTRPALLSIACEALGGDPKTTVQIGTALILIGGAVDIHDDIIDRSRTKGRTTVYGKYGMEMALLVGDAILLKGFTLLQKAYRDVQPEVLDTIYGLIKDSFYELGEAEALEIDVRGEKTLEIDEYLAIVKKKAADFEAYMRVGAALANASEDETEALGKYGRKLGMLIILGDDNSDMLDPSELINRIEKEVLPLPVLHALEEPDLKRKLTPILLKKKISKKDAETILDMIYNAGIFDIVGNTLKSLISEGKLLLANLKNRKLLSLILESTYPE